MIAMHECCSRRIAEYIGQNIGALAANPAGVFGIIFRKAARKGLSICGDNIHHIAPDKAAFHARCPCRQQACAGH